MVIIECMCEYEAKGTCVVIYLCIQMQNASLNENCTNVFIRDELSSTTEERKGVKERDDQ